MTTNPTDYSFRFYIYVFKVMLITLILRIIKVKILKLNLRSKIISISLNNLFYWGKKKDENGSSVYIH